MNSRSDALTPACSAGESRNQRNQANDQMNPSDPNAMNSVRQSKYTSSAVTSNGVNPPARCAPMKKVPCAVPRSRAGNHRENVRATFGQAPASPPPTQNRMANTEG